MFSLKEFIKRGLLNAIGQMADYQIILNAVGWFEKGVFTEEDLNEIQNALDEWHRRHDPQPEPEPEPDDSPLEEPVEEQLE